MTRTVCTKCGGEEYTQMEGINVKCTTCELEVPYFARSRVKRVKSSSFVYRGILVEVNGPYSYGNRRVVVHFHDIEGYFKSTAGVRAAIDKHLATYKQPEGEIPF